MKQINKKEILCLKSTNKSISFVVYQVKRDFFAKIKVWLVVIVLLIQGKFSKAKKNKGASMQSLVLHPTDMSQWHALVNEAQYRSQLNLKEITESYLVLMLMRYAQNPCLIESLLATEYFKIHNKPKRIKIDILQDLGDKSLLFCGLFPGIAKRRRVSISYYADMGRSAYYSISALVQQDDNLFYQLGHTFKDLQTVLKHLRIDSWLDKQLSIIQ